MKNGDLGYDQMQPNTLKHSDDKPEIEFWSGLPSKSNKPLIGQELNLTEERAFFIHG